MRILTKKITGCENSIEEIENGLDELTGKIGSMDSSHQDPGDQVLFIKYGKLKKELDQKMKEWEEFHSEFESLKKSQYHI